MISLLFWKPVERILQIFGGKYFLWSWIDPKGRSGGILLGINPSIFDIGFISQGDYHIKFRMRNKVDGFQWNLIAVYGVAQAEQKKMLFD